MPDEASEEEGVVAMREVGVVVVLAVRVVGGIGSGINVPIHLQGSVGLASLLTPGAVGLCSGGSGASSGGSGTATGTSPGPGPSQSLNPLISAAITTPSSESLGTLIAIATGKLWHHLHNQNGETHNSDSGVKAAAKAAQACDYDAVASDIAKQIARAEAPGDAKHVTNKLDAFLDPAQSGRIGPTREESEVAPTAAAPVSVGPSTQVSFSRHATLHPSAASGTAGHMGANAGDVESVSNFSSWKANACVFGGKWQYEVCLRTAGIQQIGWVTDACSFTHEEGVGDASDSYAYDGKRVKKWNVASQPYGQPWECGDVIGCVLDVDKGTASFYRNGEALGTAFSSVRRARPMLAYYPAVSLSQGERSEVNVGERPFLYPVEGHTPLCYPPSDDRCKVCMRLFLRMCEMARWRDAMPDHVAAIAHLVVAPMLRLMTDRREGAYLVSKIAVPVLMTIAVDKLDVPAHAYCEEDHADDGDGKDDATPATATTTAPRSLRRFDACAAVEAVAAGNDVGGSSSSSSSGGGGGGGGGSSRSSRQSLDSRLHPILDLLYTTAPDLEVLREFIYLLMDEVSRLVRSSPFVSTTAPLDSDAGQLARPAPWADGWLARGVACETSDRPRSLAEAIMRHSTTLCAWYEGADGESAPEPVARAWSMRRYARRFSLAMEGLLVMKPPTAKDLKRMLPDASSVADDGENEMGGDNDTGVATSAVPSPSPASAAAASASDAAKPKKSHKPKKGQSPHHGVISAANARFRRGWDVMLAAVTSAERSHDRILAILCRQAPKFFFDVYLKRVLLTNKGHRRETPPGGLMERSALMSTYFVLLRALERHIVAARAVFADKLIQEKGVPQPSSEWNRVVGRLDVDSRPPLLVYPVLDVWTSSFAAMLDMNRLGGGYNHLNSEYPQADLVRSPVIVSPMAATAISNCIGSAGGSAAGNDELSKGTGTTIPPFASVDEWCARLKGARQKESRRHEEDEGRSSESFAIPANHAHTCLDYVLLLYHVCASTSYKSTGQQLQAYASLVRQMDETRARISRCGDTEASEPAAVTSSASTSSSRTAADGAAYALADESGGGGGGGGGEGQSAGDRTVGTSTSASTSAPLSSNRMYANTLRQALRAQEDEQADLRRQCALKDVLLYGAEKQAASLHLLAYALQVLHATSSTRGDVLRYAPDYWVEGSVDLFHALRRGDPVLPAMEVLMVPTGAASFVDLGERFTSLPHLGTMNELTSFLTKHLDDSRILSPDTKDVLLQSLLVLLQYPEYVRAFEVCSSSREQLAPTLLRTFNETLWIPTMNAWLRLVSGCGFAQQHKQSASEDAVDPWVARALGLPKARLLDVERSWIDVEDGVEAKPRGSSRWFQSQLRKLLLDNPTEYERVLTRVLSSANWTATELSAAAREAEVAGRRRAREGGLAASRASLAELQSYRRKCLIMLELTTSLLRLLEFLLLCEPCIFLGGRERHPPTEPREVSTGRARLSRVYETLSFTLSHLMGSNGERALREAHKGAGGDERERMRDGLYAPVVGALLALREVSDGSLDPIADLARLDSDASADGGADAASPGSSNDSDGPLLAGVRALCDHAFASLRRSGELSEAALEAARCVLTGVFDVLVDVSKEVADDDDDDIPDDLLDPLTATLMADPVMLPTSKVVVDRATILRHLATGNGFDPFSREPLTEDDLLDAVEVRAQLAEWRASKCSK
ncbi:E3 ubiquitin-protein ligase RKP [Pycnococcus provasolii]